MTAAVDVIDITRDPVLNTPGRRLNNWTAVTNPGATDDDDAGGGPPGGHSGYEPGSRWLNTITKVIWTCVVNTVGAAEWTAGGSGGGGDVFGFWQPASPAVPPPHTQTIWWDTDAVPSGGWPGFSALGSDLSQIDYADAAVVGATGKAPDAGHQHPVSAKLQHASITFEYGPSAQVGDWHLIPIPWDFTPVGYRIMGDVSGSVSFNVWSDLWANGQPTVADNIVASALPSASSAIQVDSTTMTGWTMAWVRGRALRVSIATLTTMTQVTLEFYGNKT